MSRDVHCRRDRPASPFPASPAPGSAPGLPSRSVHRPPGLLVESSAIADVALRTADRASVLSRDGDSGRCRQRTTSRQRRQRSRPELRAELAAAQSGGGPRLAPTAPESPRRPAHRMGCAAPWTTSHLPAASGVQPTMRWVIDRQQRTRSAWRRRPVPTLCASSTASWDRHRRAVLRCLGITGRLTLPRCRFSAQRAERSSAVSRVERRRRAWRPGSV